MATFVGYGSKGVKREEYTKTNMCKNGMLFSNHIGCFIKEVRIVQGAKCARDECQSECVKYEFDDGNYDALNKKKQTIEVYVLKNIRQGGYYHPDADFYTERGGKFTLDISQAKFYKDEKGPKRSIANKSTYVWDEVRPFCKPVKVRLTLEELEVTE